MNKKKSRSAGVSVSMLKTADGRIQLAIGDHTVTVTHDEAEALALTLLRMIKSDAV